MNTIFVKCGKKCIFPLILTLILSQSVFAGDKKSDSTCFRQIDSLLSYDDYIDVTLDDGIEYSGKIRKISNDTLVIRYNSVLNYQSPVIHTIMTDQISKIKYSGFREEYKFLPKRYTRILFFSAGVYYSFANRDKSAQGDGSLDSKSTLLGMGGAILLGEIVNMLTIKKIRMNITIQCN